MKLRAFLLAIVLSSVINALSVFWGFDAYATYVADFTRVSEEVVARRSSGLVGNSNSLAIQAVLPLFALALWREHASKFVWLAAAVCAVYVVGESGSRKGLYLALLAIPYIAFSLPSKRRAMVVASGLICMVVILVMVLTEGLAFLPQGIREWEVVRRIELWTIGYDGSYLLRMQLIDRGIQAFVDSPFVGYGLDQFRSVAGEGYYAHNNFLEIAVNGGLLMLMAYYSIYLSSAIRAFRLYRSNGKQYLFHWALLFVMLGLEVGMVSYSDKFFVLMLVLLSATSQRGVKKATYSNERPFVHKARLSASFRQPELT